MSVWDVFAALGRRWYVLLLGLVLTGAALALVQVQPPVQFSRAQVYFLAPSSTLNPNVLRIESLDLVSAAGVVGKRVNGTRTLTETASMDVTLMGRGILDGSSVMLPDNGGQWSVSHDTQSLDVQVAAATPELVRERQDEIFDRIRTELDALQEQMKVPPGNLITTEIVPANPPVVAVSGERRRAQVMILALGCAATLLLVGELELRSARRRSRRAARPTEG